MLPSGHVGLAWTRREVEFAVRRSNPLWEALELSAGGQREQVLSRLRSTLALAPPAPSPGDWAAARETLLPLEGPWWATVRRQLRLRWLELRAAGGLVLRVLL